MSDRFCVEKCGGLGFRVWDNRIGEFLGFSGGFDDLTEVCRVLNIFDKRVECLKEQITVLRKFADMEQVNMFWESENR